MEAIEERLAIESSSVDVGNGRRVLVIRVPNSAKKPHSVRHQGHIYFPSRRERQRYHLSVQEIKELVMRTASRVQQAEEVLQGSFLGVLRQTDSPYLIVGMIPVFFEDFLVDVSTERVRLAVGSFSRTGDVEYSNPTFSFDGIERRGERYEHTVRFRRNGLLNSSLQLPLIPRQDLNQHLISPSAIDILLRAFLFRAGTVFEAGAIGGPYILGMMLRTLRPLVGVYPAAGGLGEQHTPPPYLRATIGFHICKSTTLAASIESSGRFVTNRTRCSVKRDRRTSPSRARGRGGDLGC